MHWDGVSGKSSMCGCTDSGFAERLMPKHSDVERVSSQRGQYLGKSVRLIAKELALSTATRNDCCKACLVTAEWWKRLSSYLTAIDRAILPASPLTSIQLPRAAFSEGWMCSTPATVGRVRLAL
eukprot:1920948-Amphidinium_carterae.2